MNIEEKLQHFYELSMEQAKEEGDKLFSSHKDALDASFRDHQKARQRQAEATLKAASEKLKRTLNKDIAMQQIEIRRKTSALTLELKDTLFKEVSQKLMAFKASQAYQENICRQIREALAFAEGDPMTIYLDPSDEGLAPAIVACVGIDGFEPKISSFSFLGGMRAVIPSKNILIDHSFASLLKEEQENFSLEVAL